MTNLLRKSPLVILWAVVTIALLAMVWLGSRQVNDSLSVYIRTDKMQHIIAFGVLGAMAALMRSATWRIRGLAVTVTLAVLVECVQIPMEGRTTSLSDLLAGIVGTFAGFGFWVAAGTALAQLREAISSGDAPAARRPSQET